MKHRRKGFPPRTGARHPLHRADVRTGRDAQDERDDTERAAR